MSQKPDSIAPIEAAALTLFHANPQLTTWDAVEQVIGDIPTERLEVIYRRSGYAWCREALRLGGDHLDGDAIENIAAHMRRDPKIRGADDGRARQPTKPRREPGRRRSGRRRRPGRR